MAILLLKIVLWTVAVLMTGIFGIQLLAAILISASPRILRERVRVQLYPPLIACVIFYILSQLP